MSDFVQNAVNTLVNKSEFKNKLKIHLDNIMNDGKITLSDLPDLILFLVECYNNKSTEKLSSIDIPDFIRKLVTYIIDENNVIPDEQEEAFINLVEVAIKLVMVRPQIRKFCLNNLMCSKN